MEQCCSSNYSHFIETGQSWIRFIRVYHFVFVAAGNPQMNLTLLLCSVILKRNILEYLSKLSYIPSLYISSTSPLRVLPGSGQISPSRASQSEISHCTSYQLQAFQLLLLLDDLLPRDPAHLHSMHASCYFIQSKMIWP